VPKPAHLETRGGCWFENSRLKLHLGVDTDFRPARRAHPALLVEGLGDLVALLRDRGVTVVEDQPLEGHYRVYADDPFGNRVELMEPDLQSFISANFARQGSDVPSCWFRSDV